MRRVLPRRLSEEKRPNVTLARIRAFAQRSRKREETTMKTTLIAAALALFATAAAADPVEGIWKTKPDDNGNFGHIQIKPCGAAFCGTLIKAFDSAGNQMESPNVGRKIIWDMVAYDGGLYDDGQVYAPDRDKTYNGEMQLNGNGLTVSGCVLGICREGGTWTRVK
jgi:uncharacterized protein (DUF2147 family)